MQSNDNAWRGSMSGGAQMRPRDVAGGQPRGKTIPAVPPSGGYRPAGPQKQMPQGGGYQPAGPQRQQGSGYQPAGPQRQQGAQGGGYQPAGPQKGLQPAQGQQGEYAKKYGAPCLEMFYDEFMNIASQFGDFDKAFADSALNAWKYVPMAERKFSYESAEFAAHYLVAFIGGLVIGDPNLLKICTDCISTEIALDKADEQTRMNVRRQEQDGVTAPPSTEGILAGVTTFSVEQMTVFFTIVNMNFQSTNGTAFSQAINDAAARGYDRATVGAILSAFPYLLRGIANNWDFYANLIDSLTSIAQRYSLTIM